MTFRKQSSDDKNVECCKTHSLAAQEAMQLAKKRAEIEWAEKVITAHVQEHVDGFKDAGQYTTNEAWVGGGKVAGADRIEDRLNGFLKKHETSDNLRRQIAELKEELLCRELRKERDLLKEKLAYRTSNER